MKANNGSKVAVNAFLIVINWCTNFEVSRGGLVYQLGHVLEGPGLESQ
jgi:hypothetical protein